MAAQTAANDPARDQPAQVGGGNNLPTFEFDPEMGWTFDLDTGMDRDLSDDLKYIAEDAKAVREEARAYLKECDIPETNFKELKHLDGEVGDDEESISNSTLFHACNKVYHNRFGMRTSVADTCINPRFGNFAEELVIKPDHQFQTYVSVKNRSAWSDMSWIDIPKIRLALGVQPTRITHSSTKDGKYNMVGSRQAWISSNHPTAGIYEIFSLFQDLNLGVVSEDKPAYLPTALGGYGKQIPFRNCENYERFIFSYKNGRYKELYRELVQRTSSFLNRWLQGERPDVDPMLDYVSRTESFFSDWIKHHSVYAPVCRLDLPPEVERARVETRGRNAVVDDVVGRLLGEGLLLTETKVMSIVEHNELCRALGGATNIQEFRKLRDSARKEWSNSSAFSDSMRDLFFEEIIFDRSKHAGTPRIFQEFVRLTRETRGNLKSILRKEAVFDKNTIDEIYSRGPMMVQINGLLLPELGSSEFAVVPDHDIFEPEEVQGLENLLLWLKGPKTTAPPLALINDDNTLIETAAQSRKPAILLVTNDTKLCRAMNRRIRKPVLRVPCDWYLRIVAFTDTGNKEEIEDFFYKVSPLKYHEYELIVDTGSLDSEMANSQTTGQAGSKNYGCEFGFFKRLTDKDEVDESEGHLRAQMGGYFNHPDPYSFVYGSKDSGVIPKRSRAGVPRR